MLKQELTDFAARKIFAITSIGYGKSDGMLNAECNGGRWPAGIRAHAGGSNLSYSATADQYSYIWKTDKAWKGTCRIMVIKLKDGTEHLAKFKFKVSRGGISDGCRGRLY